LEGSFFFKEIGSEHAKGIDKGKNALPPIKVINDENNKTKQCYEEDNYEENGDG